MLQSGLARTKPQNTLASQVRGKINLELVQPLLQEDVKYLAFRLVWNQREHQNTETIWANMFEFQRQMCRQLMTVPGVYFFICSITATKTGTTGDIHPGLGFWVVADPYQIIDCQVYTMIRNNGFGAELKILKQRSTDQLDHGQVHSLSIILKDMGVGYVSKKLVDAGGSPNYHKDRVFLKAGSARYADILLNAQMKLVSCGLNLHIQTF